MDYESYKALQVERKDGILRVTIDRPEARNAINADLHAEFGRIFTDAERDEETEVVILTGSGKSFCAGGDLEWISSMNGKPLEAIGVIRNDRQIQNSMLDLEKPIIARVVGPAVGLGCSAIDNAIHSPFFYLPTFYLWVDTMQGSTAADAWRHLRAEWVEVMRTCVVIWVPLQLLNFTLVPPARRVVFMNSCMLGWNVILDYMSHRAELVCPSSSLPTLPAGLFTATARVCLWMQEAAKDCAR